ncbi:MAG: dephospho-CoA kinase [Pyrinomonadaceae bacterium MAG19_C2-C3]|nr:dephospho-CoA kinase [Pyrinomonadaceae bacterium MAG19_C2-C3]
MIHAGLTGSIAVGKSFVLNVFAQLGCHTVDADVIAREVVRRGTTGLEAVVDEFGETVLDADGNLDRAALGAIVFNDEAKRLRLNAILHPRIINHQQALQREWEQAAPEGVSVVEAALIIEGIIASKGNVESKDAICNRFDKLIVVHCRPDVQLQRLMARNNMDEREAVRRISAQMPQAEKMLYADYLIDSSDGFDDTQRQTKSVYDELKTLAMTTKRTT